MNGNQQNLPPQAQGIISNYQQIQGEPQKEQYARNLAKMAGISDAELDSMIQQARQNPNMSGQGGGMSGSLMNGMVNNIMNNLMNGFMK